MEIEYSFVCHSYKEERVLFCHLICVYYWILLNISSFPLSSNSWSNRQNSQTNVFALSLTICCWVGIEMKICSKLMIKAFVDKILLKRNLKSDWYQKRLLKVFENSHFQEFWGIGTTLFVYAFKPNSRFVELPSIN